MSLSTISAAVSTILDAITGVHNVEIEEPNAFDSEGAEVDRKHNGRVHFWTIKVDPIESDGGVGFVELRRRVSIDGFIGIARDAPNDGTVSDIAAKALLALVDSTFTDPDNRTLSGVVLDGFDYRPGPVTRVTRNVGQEPHECHRLPFTFTVAEDA